MAKISRARVAELKAEALCMAGHGSTRAEICVALGVSESSVRRWLAEQSSVVKAEIDAAPADDAATAPKITVPDASAPATGDKLADALSAAGEAPQNPPTAAASSLPPSGAQPVGASPAIDPRAQGEALVAFAEQASLVACRVFAQVKKVPWTDDLSRASRFSKEDKTMLMMSAPAAAPYVQTLLAQSEKITAGLFALSFGLLMSTRFGEIKKLIPAKEPPKPGDDAAKTPLTVMK